MPERSIEDLEKLLFPRLRSEDGYLISLSKRQVLALFDEYIQACEAEGVPPRFSKCFPLECEATGGNVGCDVVYVK